MQICLAGLSHKTASLDVREKIAIAPEDYGRFLAEIAALPAIAEIAVLSTCNRTELYAAAHSYHAGRRSLEIALADRARAAGVELGESVYHQHGPAAARHLFRVASSLDSLVVGEPQILGQVKDAYRAALETGRTGIVLDRLFPHALETGKRVRTETAIGAYAVSISSAAVELARKIFGALEGRRALVVGAGEMAELSLRHLYEAGVRDITIANRSLSAAEALAAPFHARAVGLDGVSAALSTSDIVIAQAASPIPILFRPEFERAMKERKNRSVFVIDIAVPRNVEPGVGKLYNVYLYDLDDLARVVEGNMGRRSREAERAEQIVEHETARFVKWWEGLEVVPTIVALRAKLEGLRDQETRKLLARLDHLSEADRRQVEQFAAQLVQKILHDPTSQIRNAGEAERCSALAAGLRYLFRLEDEPAAAPAAPPHEEPVDEAEHAGPTS
jgi:glutamyl-tRNA reductase